MIKNWWCIHCATLKSFVVCGSTGIDDESEVEGCCSDVPGTRGEYIGSGLFSDAKELVVKFELSWWEIERNIFINGRPDCIWSVLLGTNEVGGRVGCEESGW